VIIGGQSGHPTAGSPVTTTVSLTPWYERLWQSVQQADRNGPR
jgi:hypothetical protein